MKKNAHKQFNESLSVNFKQSQKDNSGQPYPRWSI